MDESRTFAQAVHARLATDILNGHLAPGTKLRLQTMCDAYQVSMSPLREALACLAGRGLVVQEGQRGFRVAQASADDLRDITQTRISIETTALRLSIERGDDAWEAGILGAHHRLSRRPRSENLLIDEAWEELHRGYHMALIAACDLPRLLAFCTILHDHFDRYRRLAVLHGARHPVLKSRRRWPRTSRGPKICSPPTSVKARHNSRCCSEPTDWLSFPQPWSEVAHCLLALASCCDNHF
jgi:GntR family transcriptional regulator, carbon starvation induced regulator